MSDFASIRYESDDRIARITLARPPLNVMTIEMMEEIGAALALVEEQPSLKALLVAAEGKAFSAGVAIEDHGADLVKPMLETFHTIFRRLRALDCVTVAAVQGAALGGGAELATFCDIVLASETATVGQPEIKVGVVPTVAVLHYPRRVGATRALRLLVTGEVLPAADAERIGLVDRVVPAATLAEAVEAELARLRALSAPVLRLIKRALRDSLGAEFTQALGALEDVYRFELMTLEDAEEGLRAFIEKRPPVWKEC
jgi:cyclohexa-1,5-dienecarbonyl-CoA hydratase